MKSIKNWSNCSTYKQNCRPKGSEERNLRYGGEGGFNDEATNTDFAAQQKIT